MSQPAVTSPNPPGAQPSGAAVYSSTNAAGRPGGGTQGFGAYFKTIPGILKIVSVVLGLLAMSVTAYAYNNGLWFTKDRVYCHRGYCENVRLASYPEEEVCKDAKDRIKICPTRWLVAPQTFIIAFAWVGTLIVLIVLIFVDLSKNPTFAIVDMIGHLVAGGLVIVSGLCLLGFSVIVWINNVCKGNDPQRRTIQENFSYTTNTTANGRQQQQTKEPTCAEQEYELFQQLHIFFGAIFAFATGALYIVIGIMSLKPKRGQQVRPMMAGQFGAPAQTQSAPYQR